MTKFPLKESNQAKHSRQMTDFGKEHITPKIKNPKKTASLRTLLTIYRSNRAEWLARVLSEDLRLTPPDPFVKVAVVVNTWPTSCWLREQLAIVNEISAQIQFPFPRSHLRKLALTVLGRKENSDDPWKASRLVWPILELMPEILKTAEGADLKEWLQQYPSTEEFLNRERWQLARKIADAFDDYALYRHELITEWHEGLERSSNYLKNLSPQMRWQPLLFKALTKHINADPFGILVKKAIRRLKGGEVPAELLPSDLYLFGVSSLSSAQIEFVQALSGLINVKLFLITPCPDLWQRCKNRRDQLGKSWNTPTDGRWLLEAPRLEGSLGRMGAEFQQLLEGSGECQLGQWREGDLFAAPANMAIQSKREPTFLEQIQQNLIQDGDPNNLKRKIDDSSLIFLACPSQWRQVQVIRDQIIQWFAEDQSLEPRDVLIMTPQIKRLSPLIAAVFNDQTATNVDLPWRITDRSQQEKPGLTKFMLDLLNLANNRLTSTSLDSLLTNPALQKQQNLDQEASNNIISYLQLTGFRWGLDAIERGGDEIHSLSWCLERWLLGLVLPNKPGLAPRGIAPFNEGISPAEIKQWWYLLSTISNQLNTFRSARTCKEWIELLKSSIKDLFKDGGAWSWENQNIINALEEWRKVAGNCQLKFDSSVALDVLNEALSIEGSRYGHRSGKITISALEPMRAIPHRVIILMGMDADIFPRHKDRPSFHLLEQTRMLGDPSNSDKDRYVLLEALMSTRQHLLISWNSRNEKTGEFNPAPTPIQQWLGNLEADLDKESFSGLIKHPPLNPLDRRNFIKQNSSPALSCDRRNLEARLWLDKNIKPSPLALALPFRWSSEHQTNPSIPHETLKEWLKGPQVLWLKQLKIQSSEWITPIKDLEDLKLTELDRHFLLSKKIEHFIDQLNDNLNTPINNSILGNWQNENKGKGIFPPNSAASLEYDLLDRRLQHIQSSLQSLGPCRKHLLKMSDRPIRLLLAGDHTVIIEPGKLKSKVVMEAWLTHLYVCANNYPSTGTVVIARNSSQTKKDEFHIALKLDRLQIKEAKEHLINLKSIVSQGLKECWPVPPESGWAFAKEMNKGPNKAKSAFIRQWEGSFMILGERDKPEMKLCFGTDLTAKDFLENRSFKNAISLLYDPLINCLKK